MPEGWRVPASRMPWTACPGFAIENHTKEPLNGKQPPNTFLAECLVMTALHRS